jgi:hypothetical protein
MHRITATGPRNVSILSLLILISLLFTACTPPPIAAPSATSTAAEVIDTQIPQAEATATPEPEIDRLVLVANPPQPQVENFLRDLAEQSGMDLEVLVETKPDELLSTWKVVVMLPAPENINEWMSAAPGTQFVVSSDVDLPAAPNLSVIRSRMEHLAFAAGFIGAVITPDWRIAGLLPSDTALADRMADAFQNGGYYYCGLCRTLYAPFARWPQTRSLPTESDDAAWLAAWAELEPSIVYGVYVDSRIESLELLDLLAGKNIVLLGGQTPAAEILPRWAVTIRPQYLSALTEIMPGVLAGSGGVTRNAGLELIDINPRLLSPGRQRLIETMLEDLNAGFIQTITLPE